MQNISTFIITLSAICLSTMLYAQDTIHHVYFETGETAGIIIKNNNIYSAKAFNQNRLEIFNRTIHHNDSICKFEFQHYDSGAVKEILIINTDRPGTYMEENIKFDENGLNKNADIKRHFDRNAEIRSEPQEFKHEGIFLKPRQN